MKYCPKNWCRAFFSNRCKSDVVENNMCETFNSTILQARFKPIVSMLDDIREAALVRLANNKILVDKWPTEWSPVCMEKFQLNRLDALSCNVIFNGVDGYEIVDGGDRHTVFLDNKLCTCRAWDLTGIPCLHAIRALDHAKIDPVSQISHWYHKSTYIASYQYAMQPMPGKKFMRCEGFEELEPPPVVKMPGKPKTKRVKAANEPRKKPSSGKLTIKGCKQRYGNCKMEGHNRKSFTTPMPQVS